MTTAENITADQDARVFEVDFQSLSRSGRRWTAQFNLGTHAENCAAAVAVAWKHNANIIGQRFLNGPNA